MNVIFAPYVEERRAGWHWPYACQANPSHYMLDLADSTAADVLETIGFAGETFLNDPLPLKVFAGYVSRALHDRRKSRRSETETSLIALAELARQSQQIGATHIAWS